MKQQLESLQTRMDALTLRERVSLFATALTLLASAWYLGFMEPLAQRADRLRNEIEALSIRVEAVNRNLDAQVLQLSGTGSETSNRLAVIQGRIDEVNETLGDYAAELIDPTEMAQVLEGVLERQTRLRLVRMRNLSGEVLSATGEEDGATLYKHGLEIEFEGGYLASLEYLRELEALPWRLYWQLFELETQEHPTNLIRIHVSTLSLDEEWIGV